MLNSIHTAYRGIISEKTHLVMSNFITFEKVLNDDIYCAVYTGDLDNDGAFSAMFEREMIDSPGDRGFNNLSRGVPKPDTRLEINLLEGDMRLRISFEAGDNNLRWEISGVQYAHQFEAIIALIDSALTKITTSSITGTVRTFTSETLSGAVINQYI